MRRCLCWLGIHRLWRGRHWKEFALEVALPVRCGRCGAAFLTDGRRWQRRRRAG